MQLSQKLAKNIVSGQPGCIWIPPPEPAARRCRNSQARTPALRSAAVPAASSWGVPPRDPPLAWWWYQDAPGQPLLVHLVITVTLEAAYFAGTCKLRPCFSAEDPQAAGITPARSRPNSLDRDSGYMNPSKYSSRRIRSTVPSPLLG